MKKYFAFECVLVFNLENIIYLGTYLLLVLEIVFQALRYVMDYCKYWQRILDKDSFSFFLFFLLWFWDPMKGVGPETFD